MLAYPNKKYKFQTSSRFSSLCTLLAFVAQAIFPAQVSAQMMASTPVVVNVPSVPLYQIPINTSLIDRDAVLSVFAETPALLTTWNTTGNVSTGTALGSVEDSWTFNGFAEVMGYSASVSGAGAYAASFSRDKFGRITQKTETLIGATDIYDYSYDLTGRLIEVEEEKLSGFDFEVAHIG